MENVTLLSLNKLAKELGFNKSKLSYYVSMKLLEPVNTIGKMMIFNKKEAVELVKKIDKWQKSGLGLKEIKEKIDQ